MGKDRKIKYSVSPQSMWGLFPLKSFAQGNNVFEQTYGGLFYMGPMIKSCKGGGKVSQMHFPVI